MYPSRLYGKKDVVEFGNAFQRPTEDRTCFELRRVEVRQLRKGVLKGHDGVRVV